LDCPFTFPFCSEIFQSIILVENPLQRIEILSTSDSCYTVQAKDNFQEEKKCSEYLLSLLLTKTDLLSQMTDIIKYRRNKKILVVLFFYFIKNVILL
jgi:hypothetical protein